MINGDQNSNNFEWNGFERRSNNREDSNDWYKYKYLMLNKLEMLEKAFKGIDEKVGNLEISFIKLQTKIMMVSGISGFASAAIATAVLTAVADNIFGK